MKQQNNTTDIYYRLIMCVFLFKFLSFHGNVIKHRDILTDKLRCAIFGNLFNSLTISSRISPCRQNRPQFITLLCFLPIHPEQPHKLGVTANLAQQKYKHPGTLCHKHIVTYQLAFCGLLVSAIKPRFRTFRVSITPWS